MIDKGRNPTMVRPDSRTRTPNLDALDWGVAEASPPATPTAPAN